MKFYDMAYFILTLTDGKVFTLGRPPLAALEFGFAR
jgi:hypothetical protein